MVHYSPRQVAALTSAALAVFSWLLFLLQGGTEKWLSASVASAVIFGAGFLLIAYGIQRFIHARIKVIYRTVHDLRLSRPSEPGIDLRADLLGQVNAEVEDWAREKRQEIGELRERERYRREFIGNLAHELRTPIFSIQGYILTLLEGGLEDPKVNRDFLTRASRGVDRLMKLVEDLDLITKLESGGLRVELQRTDLTTVVQETQRALEPAAKAKNMVLARSSIGPLPVLADQGRLVQVLTNLITNAINYGKAGGHVEVKTFDLGEQLLVEVSDDGIGIAPEHLPRLFERFYRVGASRARNEGGSGLGLAIVKHIIEAHGQTITVRSTEGEGTVFAFTLAKA
jgi:two-component system, OmpR family, phosphate regulon sensor histidine kinase PhoR